MSLFPEARQRFAINLVLDYRNQHYPERPLSVFHRDFEAQYTVTTEYVERTFERIQDQVELYWVLLAHGQNRIKQL